MTGKKKPRPLMDPHKIRGSNAWWYETKSGVDVVVELELEGASKAAVVCIPWRDLIAAAKRCGAAK